MKKLLGLLGFSSLLGAFALAGPLIQDLKEGAYGTRKLEYCGYWFAQPKKKSESPTLSGASNRLDPKASDISQCDNGWVYLVKCKPKASVCKVVFHQRGQRVNMTMTLLSKESFLLKDPAEKEPLKFEFVPEK